MSGARPATSAGHALLRPVREESRRLDAGVREQMERSFGTAFGDVVVHTGGASAALAESYDAAAFTVGRHVVFGPGRFDPSSLRGRMLIGHELDHVVEQRRGGGDPDLGESAPASGLLLQHAAAGQTPALRALARGAALPSAGDVAIARQTKEEEQSWKTILRERIRDHVKLNLGVAEGVALAGGELVDTALWAGDKAVEEAVNVVTNRRYKLFDASNSPALREFTKRAKDAGMFDALPSGRVAPWITEFFDVVNEGLDDTVFEGLRPEDGFLTAREVGQIAGSLGAQGLLALIGAEEVQLGLKALAATGALKGIWEAIERNPENFGSDRNFWVAVAEAVLFMVGLRAASAKKKLMAFAVSFAMSVLSAGNEILNLRAAYFMEPGPERDAALKHALQALAIVLAGAVRDAIAHARTGGRPTRGEEQGPVPSVTTPPPTTAPQGAVRTRPLGPPAPSEAVNAQRTRPSATTPTSALADTSVAAKPPGRVQGSKPGVQAWASRQKVRESATPPASSGTAKPARPSDLKRRAEAGQRMRTRAEGRVAAATEKEQGAAARAAAAKGRLRAAQEAVEARQQAGGKPTKAQQTAVQRAQRQVAKAETNHATAKTAAQSAHTSQQAAQQTAEARSTAHAQAKAFAGSTSAKGKSVTEQYNRQWRPKEAWKQLATEELAARKAGTSTGPLTSAEYEAQAAAEAMNAPKPAGKDVGIDWGKTKGGARLPGAAQELDPLRGATDAELAHAVKTGVMPSRLNPELEHRIPQRMGRWLAKAGVPLKQAAAATKLNDPSNLTSASKGFHETVDEQRVRFRAGRDKNDPMSSLDTRTGRPLQEASDQEIAAMVASLKKPGVKLDMQVNVDGKKTTLRDVFRDEKAKRPDSTWEVP